MRLKKSRVGLVGILPSIGLPIICTLLAVVNAATAASAEEGTIAYLARTGEFWQVWTMSPDGSQHRQITKSSYEKNRVSWFPDAQRLLVSSTEGQLFEVNIKDSVERRVEVPIHGAHDAIVSPDGSRIAFSASSADAPDGNDIWTLSIVGSELTRLVRMPWLQHEPAWSPDGAWIYFVSGDGKDSHDVFRVAPDGSKTEQVTANTLYQFSPTASSRNVAYSSNRSGDYELWMQPVGSSQRAIRLTNSLGLDGAPSFSPDGRNLVFTSIRNGRLQIYRMAVDVDGTAQPIQITREALHPQGARQPSWVAKKGGEAR